MLVHRLRGVLAISVLLGAFAMVFSVSAAILSAPAAQDSGEAPAVPELSASPPQIIVPTPPLVPLDLGDARTTLRLLKDGQIREVSMYEYLLGAVSAEMPAAFEPQALAAQAVALRTYVLHHMRAAPSANHADAEVCGDFGCCAAFDDDATLREKWGESYAENLARVETAVRLTDGIYITYESEPILAVFHSSSFRATVGAEKVWSSPVPYLVSVPSPETETEVENLKSTVTITRDDFKSTVLAAFPNAKLSGDAREWITDMQLDETGRVDTIEIGGVTISGTRLREMFALRSTAVSVTLGDDIVLETMGYGHGVGMSQYGANLMAKSGKTWREILTAYYTGVGFSDYLDDKALLVPQNGAYLVLTSPPCGTISAPVRGHTAFEA